MGQDAAANEPFRDHTVGAEIQRNRLLRRQRDDFAEMPDDIHHIVVRRCARAGAGLVGGLSAGLQMLACGWVGKDAIAPSWMHRFSPGPGDLAVLVTLTGISWLALFFGSLIGRTLGERIFSRRVRRALRSGADVYEDIDRLAQESPHEAALSLARSVEFLSISAPLVALGILVLPSCIVLADFRHGWLKIDPIEVAIAHSFGWQLLIAAFSIATATAFRSGLQHPHLRGALKFFICLGSVLAVWVIPWFHLPASAALLLVVGTTMVLFRRAQRERTALGLA
jgi:hypothetical protein